MNHTIWLQELSILGFLISLYFALSYRNVISASTLLIGRICSENVCKVVTSSKYARLFGFSNFDVGLAYYTAVFILSFLSLPVTATYTILVIMWMVVAISLYLAYVLIVKLKAACTLCFAAQLINLAIAVIYTVAIA
jgi:uncharacterized membrane protein